MQLWLRLWILGIIVAAAAVCGCSKAPAPTPEEVAHQLKPDYEFTRFTILPGEVLKPEKSIKPGHWAVGTVEAVANHHDYRGELVSEFVEVSGRPIELETLPYHLRTTREALLPKEQIKLLDVLLFTNDAPLQFQLATTLVSPSGRASLEGREFIARLAAHQNYLVVLTGKPETYRYLLALNAIRFPAGELNDAPEEAHYRVVLPQEPVRAPLPESVMAWTTLAYLVWDDFAHERLTSEQREAMIDWLHWGGQIVISGPGSLDTLRGSFLEPYLPALGAESISLSAADLANLDETWSQGDDRLAVERPWTAQRLVPHARAERPLVFTIDGEPLVVERRIGRGRIVVTAFRLNQRALVAWHGYDGFFNACLLRRGPRRFERGLFGDAIRANWVESSRYDSRLTTGVRFFTRDAPAPPRGSINGVVDDRARIRRAYWSTVAEQVVGPQVPISTQQVLAAGENAPPFEPLRFGPGVAAWDDYSAASEAARATLRDAAGVVPPDAEVVLALVVAYVIVLVPVNWLVFRLLGRVEWAWGAVPVISLAFAAAVTYIGQLNVGFSRVATEVAVVETQHGYSRGHVTRYQALYSSIGTRYALAFGEGGGVALPFATRSKLLEGQGLETVDYRSTLAADALRSQGVLEGFDVSSNTTAMLHIEQMIDLGGAITSEPTAAGRMRLTNGTTMNLHGVGLVGRDRQAWVGDLAAGESREVALAAYELEDRELWGAQLNRWPKTRRAADSDAVSVRTFYALTRFAAEPDELRLVAWIDDELHGPRMTPAPTQRRASTVVIANLEYAPLRGPKVDFNRAPTVSTAQETFDLDELGLPDS